MIISFQDYFSSIEMTHNEVETRNTTKTNETEKATMLMVQFTLLERFNQGTMRKKVKKKKEGGEVYTIEWLVQDTILQEEQKGKAWQKKLRNEGPSGGGGSFAFGVKHTSCSKIKSSSEPYCNPWASSSEM